MDEEKEKDDEEEDKEHEEEGEDEEEEGEEEEWGMRRMRRKRKWRRP